jgi:hypothetical protein
MSDDIVFADASTAARLAGVLKADEDASDDIEAQDIEAQVEELSDAMFFLATAGYIPSKVDLAKARACVVRAAKLWAKAGDRYTSSLSALPSEMSRAHYRLRDALAALGRLEGA